MTRLVSRRAAGGVGFGVGAFVLSAAAGLATVAFACTDIMGPLTLTPTSGSAGTLVTTSATGLKGTPAKYELHFSTSAGSSYDCMSFTGVQVLKTIRTNRAGGWTNVRVNIPPNASLGTHNLCGMEIYPNKGGTGTTHQSFTVI